MKPSGAQGVVRSGTQAAVTSGARGAVSPPTQGAVSVAMPSMPGPCAVNRVGPE